jgi:hypothetical protein
MNRIFLAALLVVSAAHSVHAEDTFETKAKGAERVKRLENLVWALTAPCDAGDDTQRRQCRHVRDTRAAELIGATLLVDADSDAFDASTWNATKKSVPVVLTACIRCGGVDVEGKTYYLVGQSAPTGFEGTKPKVARLYDNARPFDAEPAAKAWIQQVNKARVQMLVKLAAKPKWTVDGKNGLVFDVLGYRVYSPCDGSIIGATPPSGPVEADKKACGPVTTQPTDQEPEDKTPSVELTPAVIRDSMKPVVSSAQACFEQYGVAGKAKLRITIAQDGSVAKYEQQGDFVDTPTGKCIDEAMKSVEFPKNKKPKTSISFPLVLQ